MSITKLIPVPVDDIRRRPEVNFPEVNFKVSTEILRLPTGHVVERPTYSTGNHMGSILNPLDDRASTAKKII